ncbi:MAG: lipopolysaccharide kinase InaA family protein [Planctomycetota bacterium]
MGEAELEIVRAPAGSDLTDAELRALYEAALGRSEPFRGVARLSLPGRDGERTAPDEELALKLRCVRPSRFLERLAPRPSRAFNAVALALEFQGAGVLTPRPYAAFRDAGDAATVDGLATRFVDAPDLGARLCAEPQSQHDWMRAAADAIARLHEAGFRHRDLKGSNVLLDEIGGERAVWFLDLDGARRASGPPRLGRRAREIGRLFVSLTVLGADADAFVRAYADRAGLDREEGEDLLRAVWDYESDKRARNAVRGRPLT